MHKHFFGRIFKQHKSLLFIWNGLINPSLIQPRGQYIELLRNKGVLYDVFPIFQQKLKQLYSYLMQMGSLTENKGISSILFIKLICTNPFFEVSVSNIRVSSSHGNKLENTVNTITIYHKNPQLSSNYSTIASQLLTVKESVCKKRQKTD